MVSEEILQLKYQPNFATDMTLFQAKAETQQVFTILVGLPFLTHEININIQSTNQDLSNV